MEQTNEHSDLFQYCRPRQERAISGSSTVPSNEGNDENIEAHSTFEKCHRRPMEKEVTSDSSTAPEIVENFETNELPDASSSKQLESPTASIHLDLSVKPKDSKKNSSFSFKFWKPRSSKSTKPVSPSKCTKATKPKRASSAPEISEKAKSSKLPVFSKITKLFRRKKNHSKTLTFEDAEEQGHGRYGLSRSLVKFQEPKSLVQSQGSGSGMQAEGYESTMKSQGAESLPLSQLPAQSQSFLSPSESVITESSTSSQLHYSASESQVSGSTE